MVGMLRKKHCRTCFICQCLLLKELSLSWTTLAANPIFARAPPRHGSPLQYQDESWNLAVKKKLSDDGAGARTTFDKAWFSIIFIYVLIGVWWFWCANRKSSTFLSPIAGAETWSHSTCSAWSVLIVVIRSKGVRKAGEAKWPSRWIMECQCSQRPVLWALSHLKLEWTVQRVGHCWHGCLILISSHFIVIEAMSNCQRCHFTLQIHWKDAAWKVLEQGSGYARVERLLWRSHRQQDSVSSGSSRAKQSGQVVDIRWQAVQIHPASQCQWCQCNVKLFQLFRLFLLRDSLWRKTER